MFITEKTPNGTEQYDLPSRLLKDRIITVNGEVESNMAMAITQQLLYLDAQDQTQPIVMYINSPGGSVIDGLMIVDTMNYVKSPVYTVVIGLAASMGSIIASSGAKGHRFMLPNAQYLIHQPMGGAAGGTQESDIAILAEHMSHTRDVLTKILADASGKDINIVRADTDRDNWMYAQETLDYGFIDAIVSSIDDLTVTH